jgi:dolichyl-phosphate beta-glucosyltransferase
VPTRWQAVQFASTIANQFMSRNINEEGGAYLGIPLILIALWVIVRFWSRDIVRVASIVAVTAAVLATGYRLHIAGHATRLPAPWRLLEHLPILKNVSPPRFTIFIYLMLALLFAIFVDWTLSRSLPPALRLVGIGGTLLALITLFPALPYATDTAVVPAFFRGGDVRRIPEGSVVLVAPFSRAFTSDAMMWQSVTGMSFRMPEGYAYRPGPTRNPPVTALQTQLGAIYDGIDRPAVTPELLQQMRTELQAMGAHTVIVGPEPHVDEVIALFRDVLGREPVVTGGVLVWWNVTG